MPGAMVVLLKQACDKRDRAAQARRLVSALIAQDVARNLLAYAEELEDTATDLEARACALAETIAKTHSLSAELKAMVKDAKASLAESRTMLKPKA